MVSGSALFVFSLISWKVQKVTMMALISKRLGTDERFSLCPKSSLLFMGPFQTFLKVPRSLMPEASSES